MKESFVFLADGFEDIEAITVIDVLRRANIPVKTISITSSPEVTSAHGVTMHADTVYNETLFDNADWLICPGGMPGAQNLAEFAPLTRLLKKHADNGGRMAAICAAPAVVFGQLGLLEGKPATCYPGFEHLCTGAIMEDKPVVSTPDMVLGNGPSNAVLWSLAIVKATLGEETSRKIAGDMLLYPRSMEDIEHIFG